MPPDPEILESMLRDWNSRAREDANYYVAFGRRGQNDAEFLATAGDVMLHMQSELRRIPPQSRETALEIGCGPGRLMRPLSRHFTEIHGVDVSDEMVRLAQDRLKDVPNAHPRHGTGADLSPLPDAMFDFVYSYAVFQHIPSRDVVFSYLREAWRVLKTGGILRCQLNGLPAHAKQYDTWSGVRISPDEIRQFARDQDFQLLALEEIWTQYMWITCRKPPAEAPPAGPPPVIRKISNALTGEAAVPATGTLAALSVWVERLPADADLNNLTVTADGLPCRVIYIGPPASDGISQVNVALPESIRTGLIPVQLAGAEGWVRVVPPAPSVPRIMAVTDGVNLLSPNRVTSRIVKIAMRDIQHPGLFQARVDDVPVVAIESFCTDEIKQTYEFNFTLPESAAPGWHHIYITLGRREFVPVPIEVA